MAVKALNGTWDLQGTENLLAYAQAIGNNFEATKSVLSPSNTLVHVISVDGDQVSIDSRNNCNQRLFTARLNTETEEVTLDGRPVKTTVSVDGGRLVQVQKWGSAVATVVREIKDGKLVAIYSIGNVAMKRTFQKVR